MDNNVGRQAKLLTKLTIEPGDMKLDGRSSLTFLHKTGDKFYFSVKKIHGTGKSCIWLKENEFVWGK